MKQAALRKPLADGGKTLDIVPFDGSASLVCNPRINRIEFPSGEAMGVNRIKYSDCVIFMEVAGLGRGDECAATRKITEFSEERNVEQIDARSVGEPSGVFQSRWWTCGLSLVLQL